MSEDKAMAGPRQFDGLDDTKAHNAIVAIVDVYSGMLADARRTTTMLRVTIGRMTRDHEEQLIAGRKENERLRADLDAKKQETDLLHSACTSLQTEVAELRKKVPTPGEFG